VGHSSSRSDGELQPLANVVVHHPIWHADVRFAVLRDSGWRRMCSFGCLVTVDTGPPARQGTRQLVGISLFQCNGISQIIGVELGRSAVGLKLCVPIGALLAGRWRGRWGLSK